MRFDLHALEPARARVRYNHALALQRIGRTQEAEAELLAARATGASERDVLHALVMLYAQSDQWERALPHARALVELAPGEGPRSLLRRGRLPVEVQMPGLERFGRQLDRRVNHLTLGMILAALILAAALSLRGSGGPSVGSVPLFGLLGFASSLAVAAWWFWATRHRR